MMQQEFSSITLYITDLTKNDPIPQYRKPLRPPHTYLSKPRELNTKGLSVILKDMVEIERPVLGHVSLFSDDRSSMINPVHHVNIRLVEGKRSNINSKQSLFPT